MVVKAVKRIPATQARERLGKIVDEVVSTGEPVIIQKRGDDQAAIVSLQDFQRLQPAEEEPLSSERERVRAALRAAGLLSEPTTKMREAAEEYNARHSPEEQEQILTELRSLRLDPPLSQIVLDNRNWELESEQTNEG